MNFSCKIDKLAVRATSYIKYTIYLVSNIHKKYIFAICSGIAIIKHNNYNNLDNLINNNIINHNHFSHQQWGRPPYGGDRPQRGFQGKAIERLLRGYWEARELFVIALWCLKKGLEYLYFSFLNLSTSLDLFCNF